MGTRDACDLCGSYVSEADFDQAALDVTGMTVCPRCLEELADASAINPRSEMGLVGGGDFWGSAANSR